ncbi:MAG: metal ABC transporter substrate-binding protein [Thermanaeromonas sp.]|uniref:metal ABC transporter substrate-binding protein n=1 Tax=Thermanaeromonas sp. TaxID=2003697 RepID=UPI002437F4E5|nr:metal ABC transporter substrate-binding protein [Thermanaeromonas sp.]MCG0279062.1 metal ABC transporter substrate-binding protein [Thermanaeromonas sp.]
MAQITGSRWGGRSKGLKRVYSFLAGAMALLFLSLAVLGCGAKEAEKLKVATGTSLIADIVQRVGGDKVEVVNIVPPTSCPGHFDLKPGDVQKLAQAKLFLRHDWQGKMFTQELIDSVHNKDLQVIEIAVAGNWMAPPVQKEAVKKITEVLMEKDPAHKSYYEENAKRLLSSIEEKEKEIRAKLEAANVSTVKVLCAEMQQGFLKWAGFDIVATYGRPEELNPQKIQELISKGRQAGVKLVVDNLQSGPDAGKGIAKELGAAQVTISNFPGGFPQTDTWSAALEKNVELLLNALKRSQS